MKYAKDQTKQGDSIVTEILLPSHPIFARMAELMGVKYRLYFQNLDEMRRWLSVRGYKERGSSGDKGRYVFEQIKSDHKRKGGVFIVEKSKDVLSIDRKLFASSGDLKYVSPSQWDEACVTLSSEDLPTKEYDDDIPF